MPEAARSPLRFAGLVFVLSVPLWALGAVVSTALPFELPVSALQLLCPVAAAAILVRRDEGPGAVRRLLARAFDVRRIRRKRWYAPMVLAIPTIYVLAYVVLRLLGWPVPEPPSVPRMAALLVVFFFLAAAEELGWMGYAFRPLRQRWGPLVASLVIGAVWAVWHVVPDLENGHSAAWIGWQRLYSIALRVLIVWIFINAGGSVFAAIVVHATEDLGYAWFSADYEPAATALITLVAAAMVTLLWGKSLARLRFRWSAPEGDVDGGAEAADGHPGAAQHGLGRARSG